MKKIFIILSILVLVGLAIWYWAKEKEIPLVETIMDGLPFGSGDDAQSPTTDPSTLLGTGNTTTENVVNPQLSGPTTKLARIANTPVAGFIALARGTTTVVRYVDRATGHIHDVNLATREKTKITNQTLPKIYEAHFRPDGNAVLLRYLRNNSDVVENLSLVLTPPQATSSLYKITSTLLRGNISSVAVSVGDTLFYVLKDTSSVVSSAFNGTSLRTVLSSPFTDWRLSAENSLILYTKSSSDAPGYAYAVPGLSKLLGPLNGLIVKQNATGNRLLYSYTEGGVTKLFSKNLSGGSTSEILPVTLAEKCVWSAKEFEVIFCGAPIGGVSSSEPDSWYRGATHFSDNIWRFETETEIAQILAEPKTDLSIDIDVYEPSLSPDEDYLVFINKNDLSLWVLNLSTNE